MRFCQENLLLNSSIAFTRSLAFKMPNLIDLLSGIINEVKWYMHSQ